jgi:hypothetical protein
MAPSQDSITRWTLLMPYARVNFRRRYRRRIKPANFLLVAHDDPLAALPAGLDRAHLTPIAPFSSNHSEWLNLAWRNRFDGEPLLLTTRPAGDGRKVRVRTYRDVVLDYRLHPDPKMAASDGGPVRRGTVGVLARRAVRVTRIRYVGKETARLIDEQSGQLRVADEPYTEYGNPSEEWSELVGRLQGLRDAGAMTIRDIAGAADRSERAVQYWLNGGKTPRDPGVLARLWDVVRR